MHAIDAQPVESTADGDRRAAEYGDDLPVYLASMTQSWMTGCGAEAISPVMNPANAQTISAFCAAPYQSYEN
jgi:hypothetical protein